MQEIIQFLQGGKTEDAAIALRNFLMNELTEIDKNKPEVERRRLKELILSSKLEGYEGKARESLEDLCGSHIRKIID